MKSVCWISLVLAATACSVPFQGPPSKREIDTAAYGVSPSDVKRRCLADAQRRYTGILQVAVGTAVRAWYGELGGIGQTRDIRYGWSVPFKAYALTFTSLSQLTVQGNYFFRQNRLEAVVDNTGLHFINPPR